MSDGRHRHIRIFGTQHEQIDVDLLAQIVVMLGRELAQEEHEAEEGGSSDTSKAGQSSTMSSVQPEPVQEQDDA